MKKILTLLLGLMLAMGSISMSFGAELPPLIAADSAVLIDAATGQVLYDKQMNKQKFPASTTKVMTALLTLENLEFSQKVVIDAVTPYVSGSRIYLIEGEEVTVEQLINAMLVESANDAAAALALEISGNVPDFAKLMNARAKELGAKNTSFNNPNGLPDEAHLTTAYDLAMIARQAMTYPAFREIVTTYKYTFTATNKQPERYLYNGNRLLWDSNSKVIHNGVSIPIRYEGVTGIKTGFTNAAGSCLISSAKRNGTELIAVVLQSDPNNLFLDSIKLLDYGFAAYKSVEVVAKAMPLGTVAVKGGQVSSVIAIAKDHAMATLPLDISPDILRTEVDLPKQIMAPVTQGQKLGTIEIYEADRLVGEYDLVAESAVAESLWMNLPELALAGVPYLKYLAILLAVIGFVLLGLRIHFKRQRVKRRRLRKAEPSKANENLRK
jgi:D-alanyl-D-alanine carboxypeptidase (penicillin-binding protein 5/6)